MQTLADALLEYRRIHGPQTGSLVRDWRETLPKGSLWQAGSKCRPDCPRCLGAGWGRMDVPTWSPLFGRAIECPNADNSLAYQQSHDMAERSRLSLTALGYRWTTMLHVSHLNEAKRVVQETLDRQWGWVYLWGEPGPGKTHVLQTAVAECLSAGQPAVYITWPDLLDDLRHAISREDDTRLEQWREVGVLAIDELGRAKETEWTSEVELKLLDHRYALSTAERRTVTLIASNDAPSAYNSWLASRLTDARFACLEVKGLDMRKAMR